MTIENEVKQQLIVGEKVYTIDATENVKKCLLYKLWTYRKSTLIGLWWEKLLLYVSLNTYFFFFKIGDRMMKNVKTHNDYLFSGECVECLKIDSAENFDGIQANFRICRVGFWIRFFLVDGLAAVSYESIGIRHPVMC